MSINKVIITGNLTREPEVRALPSGTAVLNFGMAVNDRRKNNQTGEWEDYPNFIDCVMFGARAQSVSRFMAKGGKVAVEGRLHFSQWERDGQKRSKLEVVVDEIELMQQRKESAPAAPMNHPAAPVAAPAYEQQQMMGMPEQQAYNVYDEDIPF